MKPLGSFRMWTPCSISERFEGHDKVVLKHTQTKYTKQRKIIGVFICHSSVKLGDCSLLPSLSPFEGRGAVLLPSENIYWFVFFLCFYNASLSSRWLFWRWFWICLVQTWNSTCVAGREICATQIFLFLTCLSVSVNSDWVFIVLIMTLFMVSEISVLGTGTRLKSLACQTEIHF